ncbi:unnamed protein product [Boreogadus saida]
MEGRKCGVNLEMWVMVSQKKCATAAFSSRSTSTNGLEMERAAGATDHMGRGLTWSEDREAEEESEDLQEDRTAAIGRRGETAWSGWDQDQDQDLLPAPPETPTSPVQCCNQDSNE